MPITHNVDIKLSFEMFDMTPGQSGRAFRRSLLLHGGKSDTHGFSYADCFLRIDAHAVQRGQPIVVPPGGGVLAAPGAAAAPGGGGPLQTSYQLRRARLKESFRYLVMHISDSATLALLADDGAPEFQNGPDAYDLIMSQVVVAPTTDDVQSMRIEFWLTEIVCDVGVSANTVKDALKLLRFLNADFPPVDRFTDNQICEKLLKMISVASSLLGGEAKKELDAIEGVPGLPRVREFQLPAVE